ncbi:MAG: hypothetical protein PWQ22_21 [Archaeoglobaceae archaeon]|nr:hypothetical protein [Archaeoglobaceae archaeon]
MEERIRENLLAEEIMRIAEKDLNLAEKIADSIKDPDARVMAFLNLYLASKDQKFVEKALKTAEKDEDLLRIVEITGFDATSLIKDSYKRDLAYASLFERTKSLEYLEKISDVRLASASMKRVSEKLSFPFNLEVARKITDPYYRCLALIEISEKEGLDLKKEIEEALNSIENPYLQKWLRNRLIAGLKL